MYNDNSSLALLVGVTSQPVSTGPPSTEKVPKLRSTLCYLLDGGNYTSLSIHPLTTRVMTRHFPYQFKRLLVHQSVLMVPGMSLARNHLFFPPQSDVWCCDIEIGLGGWVVVYSENDWGADRGAKMMIVVAAAVPFWLSRIYLICCSRFFLPLAADCCLWFYLKQQLVCAPIGRRLTGLGSLSNFAIDLVCKLVHDLQFIQSEFVLALPPRTTRLWLLHLCWWVFGKLLILINDMVGSGWWWGGVIWMVDKLSR